MKKKFLFVFLFLLSLTAVFSLGGKDKNLNILQVTGIVRLVGNANFPELVISGDNEWYIAREEMEKLMPHQHRTVAVEGEEIILEMKFANGMPAGVRRELRNIKIISIQQ